MIIGTTPTHKFKLPIKAKKFSDIKVLYIQKDKVILKKENDELGIDGYIVKSPLSKNETRLFSDRYPLYINLRAESEYGTAVASQLWELEVKKYYTNKYPNECLPKCKREPECFFVEFGEIVEITDSDRGFYNGDYIVVPRNYSQTLETAEKIMKNNVEVTEVPYTEISNSAGGITCIIGE